MIVLGMGWLLRSGLMEHLLCVCVPSQPWAAVLVPEQCHML